MSPRIQTTVRCSRQQRLGTACLAAFLSLPGGAFAQQAPVKVGVMLPLSGVFSPNGQDALDGLRLYFDKVGGQAAGRKIDLVVEDTQGKPDVGLTKARKLVEGDKVSILTGIVSTGVALAVNPYARDKKVPLVISADAGANDLTVPGPLLNPYLVRVSQNGRTTAATGADWGYKQGWRRVSVVASDYAGGLDTIGGFTNAFCKLGGQIVQEQYPPLGTADFGPFLANLNRNVDAVVFFTPGADGLRFTRQYIELGLKNRIPLLDIYGQAAYEPNLPQLGDGGIGLLSTLHYTPMIKTAENEQFVKDFRSKTKRTPSDNGPDGYVGARAIVEAIKAVDGKLDDTDKFMRALKGVKFPSPKGDIALDQYGQVIQSMYIRKVEKVGGEYANVPVASYDKLDQFWPYTQAEYQSFKLSYADLKGKMTNCTAVLEKK